MNKLLIEYGLEPYDESILRSINTRTITCTNPICNAGLMYSADYDGDGNLSTLDLVLNLVYVRDYGDVSGTPPCGGGYIASTISHPTAVQRIGFNSYECNGTEQFRNDCDDEEVLRDFLLGLQCQ